MRVLLPPSEAKNPGGRGTPLRARNPHPTLGAARERALTALERLVAAKGVASTDALSRLKHAWEHACERTPHGRPIELKREDFEP